MPVAPSPALLVAPPRLQKGPQPSLPATAARAVALAAVAVRAHVDRTLAEVADESPAVAAQAHVEHLAWTAAPEAAILSLPRGLHPRPAAGDGRVCPDTHAVSRGAFSALFSPLRARAPSRPPGSRPPWPRSRARAGWRPPASPRRVAARSTPRRHPPRADPAAS